MTATRNDAAALAESIVGPDAWTFAELLSSDNEYLTIYFSTGIGYSYGIIIKLDNA